VAARLPREQSGHGYGSLSSLGNVHGRSARSFDSFRSSGTDIEACDETPTGPTFCPELTDDNEPRKAITKYIDPSGRQLA
jgi:hypothetical protein